MGEGGADGRTDGWTDRRTDRQTVEPEQMQALESFMLKKNASRVESRISPEISNPSVEDHTADAQAFC